MEIQHNMNRYLWADVAKGIGIFLMVFGHSGLKSASFAVNCGNHNKICSFVGCFTTHNNWVKELHAFPNREA